MAGVYRPVVADDTGFEGIACVDDTARAALLALAVYEQTQAPSALALARRWLSFVEYMQYPDGSFANFIRNAAGIRNATGPTSHRGGYWWSCRALWALARAYRVTGERNYLERYSACHLDPIGDGKIRALQALAELELYRVEPSEARRRTILEHCSVVAGAKPHPYFRDTERSSVVALWGYHQLHAVAEAAFRLEDKDLLPACRRTVDNLIQADVRDKFWYNFPMRRRNGVCAYCVTPVVQGLASMYRATRAKRYLELALLGIDWFHGRNDAGVSMYEETGRCRDGINNRIASSNFGAESSIEAGFAELERRSLPSP